MATGAVAVDIKQALDSDLQLLEQRIGDDSWTNKLNLKRAVDERVRLQALHLRLACGAPAASYKRMHGACSDCIHAPINMMLAGGGLVEQLAACRRRRSRSGSGCRTTCSACTSSSWSSSTRSLPRRTKSCCALRTKDAADLRAELSAELSAQKQILMAIAMGMGQDGDRDAVQERIDTLKLQISCIGSMQDSTMAQINRGFEQTLEAGQKQFQVLSVQNQKILADVQAGFKVNKELHEKVLNAVNTGTGSVIDNLAALQRQGRHRPRSNLRAAAAGARGAAAKWGAQ